MHDVTFIFSMIVLAVLAVLVICLFKLADCRRREKARADWMCENLDLRSTMTLTVSKTLDFPRSGNLSLYGKNWHITDAKEIGFGLLEITANEIR